MRDCIVSVLMSPDFLYRFDCATAGAGKAPLAKAVSLKSGQAFASQPLPDYSLASRLSYFLWASMPDAELLQHAAAGDLHKPAVLLAEAHRMLKDPKVKGLATEFTGNWLVFRQFETNNSVDRERFPTFDDDLREAMFQEPIHFMQDNIQNERSVLDLLYGNYTFVNPPLAQPLRHAGGGRRQRHLGQGRQCRQIWPRRHPADGGVHDGHIRPACAPARSSAATGWCRRCWASACRRRRRWCRSCPATNPRPTSRSARCWPSITRIRSAPAAICASIPSAWPLKAMVRWAMPAPRIWRAGRSMPPPPIRAAWTAPAWRACRSFIQGHRQDNFVGNLARKLLAYALNRSPQLSDESLVDKMKTNLAADGYKFRALVDTIVLSPQFLNRRVADAPSPAQARRTGKAGRAQADQDRFPQGALR